MSAPAVEDATQAETEEVEEPGVPTVEIEPPAAERPTVEVDHTPPRLSAAISVGAAILGALATAPFALLAIPFGFVGAVLVAGGLFYARSRAWLTVGVAMILGGSLISGGYGVIPVELMILGVGSTLVAWDAGQHGITIGHQLGRGARTERLEIVHVAATTIFVGLVGLFAYALFLLGASGQPAAAVSLALIGVLLLVWTFRA